MELDHVLIAVRDLERDAEELERIYGLASVEGGRHPGWGTANRIIPLGETYLELIAVVDRDAAERAEFGRWVARVAADGVQPLGWAVRTEEIDAIAARLGLEVRAGSRIRPDGTTLAWRIAGLDDSSATPSLPFFVEWRDASTHPGGASEAQGRIESLTLAGDEELLASWLGRHTLPVKVERGSGGVRKVELVDERGRPFVIGG